MDLPSIVMKKYTEKKLLANACRNILPNGRLYNVPGGEGDNADTW